MKHPSISLRLIVCSTLMVALVLVLSKIATYREVERSLRQEMDDKLMNMANLLSKSSELQAGGVIYEWQEAANSTAGPRLEGLFQFWDLKSGRTARSPDLKANDLEFFHGGMNEPVFKNLRLFNGEEGRAIGLMHLPFTNDYGEAEMERRGLDLSAKDYKQVVVCAIVSEPLEQRLASTRRNLLATGVLALLAIWVVIIVVTKWTLRPLETLASGLLKRSSEVGTPLPEIPPKLPRELVQVVTAFQITMEKVETARSHEKDFAWSAAHQLRTPVAGLNAILEQALARPREMDNLLPRIRRAHDLVGQIRQTIESLMQLARLHGGLDEVELVPFHPADIVRDLVKTYAEQPHGGRGPLLEVSIGEDEAWVRGDSRLFHVLASVLLENAFRHVSPPDGRIQIRTGVIGHDFLLTIANDSEGFDPGESERIFRPFQRGKNTSVNSPGAGLGLALAKEISVRMGATLEVGAGEGSMIAFRVKMAVSSKPGAAQFTTDGLG
jgi:signal transduction histidine kinase